jgi:hypothetical protein
MSRTLKTVLDAANPNLLPTAAQQLGLGTAMTLIPKFYQAAVTSNRMTLPNDAKCVHVLGGCIRTGTATGPFIGVRQGATLATLQAAPAGNGDILFFATDAATAADVWYLSAEPQLFTEDVVVTANVGTLLGSRSGVILVSATALAGTLTGAMTITTRGATPTTGLAALNAAGTGAVFAGADAVTSARISYYAFPGVGYNTEEAVGTKINEEVDF